MVEYRAEKEISMDNGLVDQDSNIITIVTVIGGIAVVALLLFGFFVPSPDWIF